MTKKPIYENKYLQIYARKKWNNNHLNMIFISELLVWILSFVVIIKPECLIFSLLIKPIQIIFYICMHFEIKYEGIYITSFAGETS